MILAINTSTFQFSLALMEKDGTVLTEFLMSKGKGNFGSLMPALDFLIRESKADIHSVEAIIVAEGPGSFTGLRLGISTAKGLCHALDVPVIGISSLEALACQLPYTHLPITSILDSRKGEFFAARFTWSSVHHLRRDSEDLCLKLDEFPSLFKDPAIFIGNDFEIQAPLLRELFGIQVMLAHSYCWNLRASAVGSLGLKRFKLNDFDEPQLLGPLYLRPPDITPTPFPSIPVSG